MKGTKGAALRVSGDGAVTHKGAGDPSGITVFADPQNTAGIAIADDGLGANLDASFSIQVSNATHLQDLAGPFFYVIVNADWLEGVSITLFWSPDLSVYGAEFGASGGAGAEVSAGLNYTHVDTFGGMRAAIASDVWNNIKPSFSVELLLNSVRTMILNQECSQ